MWSFGCKIVVSLPAWAPFVPPPIGNIYYFFIDIIYTFIYLFIYLFIYTNTSEHFRSHNYGEEAVRSSEGAPPLRSRSEGARGSPLFARMMARWLRMSDMNDINELDGVNENCKLIHYSIYKDH